MTAERYMAMTDGDWNLMARGIGVYSAELGDGHPGDDTARIATAAYRKMGSAAAAEVVVQYARGFNAAAGSYGLKSLTNEELLTRIGFSLTAELNDAQINEIRQALTERLEQRGAITIP